MAAEESARVARRCEEAKSSSELVLDGCDLRKFPDAIFFLMKEVELVKVNLSHNQLQKLPAKLGLKFASITSKCKQHCTAHARMCRESLQIASQQ